jgi:hypothetical protein
LKSSAQEALVDAAAMAMALVQAGVVDTLETPSYRLLLGSLLLLLLVLAEPQGQLPRRMVQQVAILTLEPL